MLKITNLTKKYGNFTAISNLNLEIEDGTIFGFIGHNGAGKTTTIKSICGIHDFEGDVTLDGISIKEEPIKYKKLISYIPDNPDLYEALTGYDYLNFIGDIYKIELSERKSLIEKYARMLDIYDNLNSPISSYSHGMKQKLAIVSSLIRKPKLLILDEPFVGLDPLATFKVKEIMHSLAKEKTIIFFSTHVLEVAQKLTDQICILKDGKMKVWGKTEDVIKDKSLEEVFLEFSHE